MRFSDGRVFECVHCEARPTDPYAHLADEHGITRPSALLIGDMRLVKGRQHRPVGPRTEVIAGPELPFDAA